LFFVFFFVVLGDKFPLVRDWTEHTPLLPFPMAQNPLHSSHFFTLALELLDWVEWAPSLLLVNIGRAFAPFHSLKGLLTPKLDTLKQGL